MDDQFDQRDPAFDQPSFLQAALALVVFDPARLRITASDAWPLLDNAQSTVIVARALQSVPIVIGGVLIFRLGRYKADVLAIQRELDRRTTTPGCESSRRGQSQVSPPNSAVICPRPASCCSTPRFRYVLVRAFG